MDYRISEDKSEMNIDDIMRLLSETYWAAHRTRGTVVSSVENSLCFAVYTEGSDVMAGFARVITDYATTYYLCDVVIDPAQRSKGLGKALIAYITAHEKLRGLMGLLLTRDAHGLYEKSGFTPVEGRAMLRIPD